MDAHNLFSFTNYSYGRNSYSVVMPTITCPLVNTRDENEAQNI